MEETRLMLEQSVAGLKLAVEASGTLVIAVGFLAALWKSLKGAVAQQPQTFVSVRLGLARYLSLALEFQLAADILGTTVAPGWGQIGKLAAVATIRTALNYFLSREMNEERAVLEQEPKS